jgi:hypothetical protein
MISRYAKAMTLIGIGSVSSIVSSIITIQANIPRPEVYVRYNDRGKRISVRPNFEIGIRNQGGTRVHIRNLQIFKHGIPVDSIGSCLEATHGKCIIDNASDELTSGPHINRQHLMENGNRVDMTILPSKEQYENGNTAWAREVRQRFIGVDAVFTCRLFPYFTRSPSITIKRPVQIE